MGLFDTDSKAKCAKFRAEAREGIKDLKEWLDSMDEQLEGYSADGSPGYNAFSITWAKTMMEKATNVYGVISRCNGAALVRGIPDKE